jgi:hypothetical protein
MCGLIMQHAVRMCRIVLSSAVCLSVQYFRTLSHKRHDFHKPIIGHKMCVVIFSTILSETFTILRRTEEDIMNMFIGLHVKYRLLVFM